MSARDFLKPLGDGVYAPEERAEHNRRLLGQARLAKDGDKHARRAGIWWILEVEKALHRSGWEGCSLMTVGAAKHILDDKKVVLHQEHIRERSALWAEMVTLLEDDAAPDLVAHIENRDRCVIMLDAEHKQLASRKERNRHSLNPLGLHLKKGIEFCLPLWEGKTLVGFEPMTPASVRVWFGEC